jgi:glutathione peroxidase-family protein
MNELVDKYGTDFAVLGFPCNQFGTREQRGEQEQRRERAELCWFSATSLVPEIREQKKSREKRAEQRSVSRVNLGNSMKT